MTMKAKALCSLVGLVLVVGATSLYGVRADSGTNSLGMTLVRVEPGTFPMGSEISRELWNERPVHEVTISQPFSITETEVTVEQFRRFRKGFEGTSVFAPYAAGVSWADAVAFAEWLSKKEGQPYRLPTEAEWEYVARAGSDDASAAVRELDQPNAWGVKNMLSGPREWCHDWFGEYPAESQVDPVGPASGSTRVVRGGSLDDEERNLLKIDFARPRSRLAIAPAFGPHLRGAVPAAVEAGAKTPDAPGFHAIGFRLVQAEMPQTAPRPVAPTLVELGVKQDTSNVTQGPDPKKPYFRKRYYLPTPLENSPNEAIDAVALHPSFRRHNHSPGVAILPNGDVLMATFTSYYEYEPGVSLIGSRLRFGADQWDMPSPIIDFAGVNDVTALLWNDEGTIYFFWGNPKLELGGFPFQWTTSTDNGATWQETRFPDFVSEIGSHSRQPINSVFRDGRGRIYLSSDGSGGESVLWASDDDAKTWFDTGGRSGGRHTTYALLKDGRILGMGGKSTDIDEFMPKSISRDGGKTWEVSKTPFSRLGSNQRPTVLRLQSGRLFFAGDFVHLNTGSQPEGLGHLGSYVALSEDEGETWHIKKLIGAQPHENRSRADRMKGATLGYAVAAQGPNGMIHLIASMTNPCLHFEMNEAWILDGPTAERSDEELMASTSSRVSDVKTYEEHYPGGAIKGSWSGGVADDGRFLLHGTETWYYEDGQKQWEVRYELGRKVGTETHWSVGGKPVWFWEHGEDGTSVWTQYWSNGEKKAESSWKNFMAEGHARRWDRSGELVSEVTFRRGQMQRR